MGLISARPNFRATEGSKIATWAKNSPIWSHCPITKNVDTANFHDRLFVKPSNCKKVRYAIKLNLQ